MFRESVDFVRADGRVAIPLIQRQFRIGCNRAARIIYGMESTGVMGPQDGTMPKANPLGAFEPRPRRPVPDSFPLRRGGGGGEPKEP
ncbi:MAG: hypothetical protein LBQ12_04305 [Deltaproteobacteria bacterium]|nr:hypothetical protein [Deltaproteobacteria bacterium]